MSSKASLNWGRVKPDTKEICMFQIITVTLTEKTIDSKDVVFSKATSKNEKFTYDIWIYDTKACVPNFSNSKYPVECLKDNKNSITNGSRKTITETMVVSLK
jgi:hypothetical protein